APPGRKQPLHRIAGGTRLSGRRHAGFPNTPESPARHFRPACWRQRNPISAAAWLPSRAREPGRSDYTCRHVREMRDGEIRMKILLIEDDREAAGYLERAFGEAGHLVHVASDGESGFMLAESGEYDVLVIDRMLPKRDGLSVVAGLRARGKDTPVLIL